MDAVAIKIVGIKSNVIELIGQTASFVIVTLNYKHSSVPQKINTGVKHGLLVLRRAM
jgi:hypothetical protein